MKDILQRSKVSLSLSLSLSILAMGAARDNLQMKQQRKRRLTLHWKLQMQMLYSKTLLKFDSHRERERERERDATVISFTTHAYECYLCKFANYLTLEDEYLLQVTCTRRRNINWPSLSLSLSPWKVLSFHLLSHSHSRSTLKGEDEMLKSPNGPTKPRHLLASHLLKWICRQKKNISVVNIPLVLLSSCEWGIFLHPCHSYSKLTIG